MKKISISVFLITLLVCLTLKPAAICAPELKPYSFLTIPKGSFFKGVNQRQINTATADEGDEVTFIASTDTWCAEAKIIPKDSIYKGYIEELNEPVQGTNAAMKIKINKVIFPDNTELDINANVTYKGSTTIGGELTPPLEYSRIPHYIYYPRVYKGVLQYVPGNKRFFGSHLVINPGAEMIIMLNEDFKALSADF